MIGRNGHRRRRDARADAAGANSGHSAAEFERRFGITAATLNNWEQGRVFECDPEAVALAARKA